MSTLVRVTIWFAVAVAVACTSPAPERPPPDPAVDASALDAPVLDSMVDATSSDGPLPIDGPSIDVPLLDASVDAVSDTRADAAVLDAPLPVDALLPVDAPLPPADAPASPVDAASPGDAPVPPADAPVPPMDAPSPTDAPLPADAALPVDAPVPPVDAPRPVDAPVNDAPLPPADAPPDAPSSTHLRVVAGNLTSGDHQAYLDPGIRIFRGLRADIALVQEFNFGGSSPAELQSFVDQAFGPGFTMARGATGQQIPNGIVSRFPILASGEWQDSESPNREYVWAQIDIPGPIDLYAISVHLLSSNQGRRNTEAGELVQNISSLPADAYVVLGGDFNTDSRSEPCIQTLSSVLVTGGPFPVDQANRSETNATRQKPYDWVLASDTLDALEIPVMIGANQFDHGFVGDTRVYVPLADLSPALKDDSGAPSMQHMAVVRDFELPDVPSPPSPPMTIEVTSPNGGETWQVGSGQVVAWTSSGIAAVRVELTSDGIAWTTLSASTPAAAGRLAVIVPATATTSARVRVSAVPGGAPSDVSNAAFTIAGNGPPAGRVLINELLANEEGSNTAGEFVELVNSTTGAVDLSSCTISDAMQARHVFASGTLLGAGRAIVVFGGASAIPPGLGNAIAASTGSLSFGNSGDTVKLICPLDPTTPVDSLTYTGAQAVDGVSLNRDPDGDGGAPFVLHDSLSTLRRSPGMRVSGSPF